LTQISNKIKKEDYIEASLLIILKFKTLNNEYIKENANQHLKQAYKQMINI